MNNQEIIAYGIQSIIRHAASLPLDDLDFFLKELEEEIKVYEAIGIVDGHNYFRELEDRKARLKRFKALRKFVTVLHETNSKIKKDE